MQIQLFNPSDYPSGKVPVGTLGLLRPIDRGFEAFYRVELRHVRGVRVRSSHLRAAYEAWAMENGFPSLSFKQIASEMAAIGHQRRSCNGRWYLDVARAADVPSVPDTLPHLVAPHQQLNARPSDILKRIDAALTELLALRRMVQQPVRAEPPHVAAERVLSERVEPSTTGEAGEC